MSHYSTLGVEKSASPEEIKAAFKKLAMTHHPDRGGDQKKFQEINEAYSVLSDPEKRMEYEHGGRNQFHFNTGNPFHFEFNTGPAGFGVPPGFDHIFREFGSGFENRARQKNRDLHIRCRISLLDSYIGKKMQMNYRLPSGIEDGLEVDIPPGIDNGQVIKVNGRGDNSMPHLPRGDLTISIEIDRDPHFFREDLTLITETDIDIFDAMIGCKKNVVNIDGGSVEVNIPAGAQHGQRFACRGLGFKNIKFNNTQGDLHVIVRIQTPKVKAPDTVAMVERLAEKIRRENS